MKPIIIDTSVWIEWIRGKNSAAIQKTHGRLLYMPAIVATELLSGARDRRSLKLIDNLIESFVRNQRLLLPSKEEYKLAGNILADLGWAASKKSNDTLITVSARRIGAEVWSLDDDFVALCKTCSVTLVTGST